MKKSIPELIATLPQVGKVTGMTVRKERRGDVIGTDTVTANTTDGLVGDHYSGQSGKRQVTLIQQEHLEGVAKLLGRADIDPALHRRNIVVSGINLLALKDRQFQIGEAILETTGPCEPCSRMEENFGPGGYNIMRGHGGICARVVRDGVIRIGDEVKALTQ